MPLQQQLFGQLPSGTAVHLLTLTNSHGVTVQLMNYGAAIVAIHTPDRDGRMADITLGFDSLSGYLDPERNSYFGCVVGRYANRIAGGQFVLNGVTYQLAVNEGGINHLHGGQRGFDKVLWDYAVAEADGAASVAFSYLSPDGEEHYPGNLRVDVTYTLTDTNALRIYYRARSDKDTILNLTNHTYFNLSGAETILDHELLINADAFTPVNSARIPTGEVRPVEGTPFDFRRPTPIGARIHQPDEQLQHGHGYDHNFVINGTPGTLRLAAIVHEPSSGRILEVHTTEPGLQLYSGNFLRGALGRAGRRYGRHSGFCLETQHFPDSPHHPHFPSVVLKAGELFESRTEFIFGVQHAHHG